MSARPVHFVLGTGRCGSTLVHETLCRHPEVLFVSNLEDRSPVFRRIARVNGAVFRALPESWSRKGRLRFAPSEAYHALDREVSPLLTEPHRDLTAADATAELVARLRSFLSDRPGPADAPVVHKFTGWPRARLLATAFPDARFVHVVRDGRAVANSWLQMPWWRGHLGPEGWHFGPLPAPYAREWAAHDHSQPVLAGLAWKLLLDAHAEAAKALGPSRWLDIRYEDFVADPVAVAEHCLKFLDVEPRPDHARRIRQLRIAAPAPGSYERGLGAAATATLTAVLADHLREWDYPV
jgi:hypothetical protein